MVLSRGTRLLRRAKEPAVVLRRSWVAMSGLYELLRRRYFNMGVKARRICPVGGTYYP